MIFHSGAVVRLGLLYGLFLLLAAAVSGQEAQTGKSPDDMAERQQKAPEPQAESNTTNAVPVAKRHWPVQLLKDFAGDQKSLWASPKHLSLSDATWLVPVGGITAGLIVTDSDFSRHSSHDAHTMSHYNTISNAGIAALAGSAGAMFIFSYGNGSARWRETGFLAGEAALNTLVLTEAAKYAFRRDRPIEGDGTGKFFQSGGTSFPSEHASVAFAIAGVIAHEYPGPLTQILAYGAAGLIGFSRVRARQHFPSDVFVGSIMGNLIAQNIYSRHFDPELGGSNWQSTSQFFREHWTVSPKTQGSPYVPLNSWVYPAIERLAAMGLVNTQFLNVRPWTRLECTNLAQEAETKLNDSVPNNEANKIVSDLRTEFATELGMFEKGTTESTARIESLYTRVTDISGPPLNDSYHFGQTIVNDEGRPYQEGLNNDTGFSAYATAGRLALYVSGEYQHAPSAPGFSQSVQNFFASIDQTPVQPATPIATTDQFRLLDTYVAVNMAGWDFTFGRQSLWWGPGDSTSLIFSDNAVPIYMARASRITPFQLPWIFGKLGPMKVDLFYGQLAGNEFPPRPLIHGEKITFKPTPNVELGFSRTAEFGGEGRALTPAAIANSYFSFVSSGQGYASNNNPGKRTGGFDFSYRLPGKWLTLYSEAISSDDPNPIDAPRRAATWSGVYMPRFPFIPKLDLRLEAGYTDTVTSRSVGGKFYYWELFYYHNLYTNYGNLIGSWIGREGVGYAASSTYHFSARDSLQFAFRRGQVDPDFVPGGVSQSDGSVKLNWWVRHDLSAAVSVQYERWAAPFLAPVAQTNWTSSVEIAYWPRTWSK
jgi:hypothetical protein